MINLILDNVIFSLQKSGGISVVWFELLKRLQFDNLNFECIEYEFISNINRKQLSIVSKNIRIRKKRFLSITRYLSPKIHCKDPFIFHSSYYRTCSNSNAINITTVHDFTYEYYYTGLKRIVHLWQKYRAISKSDYIICISENTKRDLLKFLPKTDEAKIRVIYNEVSDDYFFITERESIKLPFDLETYVLFVGSRERYKNFELTVKAVAYNKLKLVIVGAPLLAKELELLQKELGQSNFIAVGRVSNEELNHLYNGALALLYPSEYEGFGIPVLEAQRAGCPVIAYNASSIPEVIGNTPLLLNMLSIEAITKCFDILRRKEEREAIVYRGIENAKRFTWDRMYEQVIELYKEAWEASNQ